MMSIWETVVQDVAGRVPGREAAENDFLGEDGLMYCGTCKTRKQSRISVLGKEKIVPIMCQCQQDKQEAEKAAQRELAFKANVERLRKDCFHSAEAAKWTFAADDQKDKRISDAMRRYVEKWEDAKADNMGLLLFGPVGTGKSFYAACIANALIDKGVPVKMTNFARIVNELQNSFSGRQEYIDRLCSFPLLIIDDLGIERSSDFMMEQVFAVVDARYQAGLPLIVTTNVQIEEIANPTETKYKRIYDRIIEICLPIRLSGESRRRDITINKRAAQKNMLGL